MKNSNIGSQPEKNDGTRNQDRQFASAFQYKLFRALWVATMLASIATWMQNVGAGWVMLTLTPSPFMVALVQTAVTLPAFILGLPAGVMSDLINRQQLLLWTHAGMFLATGALAAVSHLGLLGPWTLLFLTFTIGCCCAVAITARQVSISDVVPRTALLHALALNSIAYNGARAVGPALAGILLAWLGSTAVFLATASIFAIVVAIQFRIDTPQPRNTATSERAFDAMLTGMRYVWHAPVLHAYFLRAILFMVCASSLWALLPVVSHDRMGFGASGYGLLLGAMGAGAVVFGAMLEPLRRRFSLDVLATASGLVFAAAILISGLSSNTVIVCISLFAGGGAWVINNSIITAAVQTVLPAWVRARAISIYMLVFQGSMAFGGALWGAVASHLNLSATLILAGIMTLCGVLYARRYPLQLGNEADVTPSMHWVEPALWSEPAPDDGPVAVQSVYRVRPEAREEFIHAIHALGITRKRDGASHWQLYRDLADPEIYVERFVVHSWAEHLRQQTRATMTDCISEEIIRKLHSGDQPIRTSHFIAQK
ncbi:MFS transporter [Noviherbaspirillum sedimenti]|uniref:MFS transporter n=1 Tax=Noviherbaspirillum sedimenti TaxID=2320865 RepID=A0A3A3G5J1_9BURK|nr:MFS transporter [Noviherbaspirillum sedimenti]RJG03084.1 MFS transporter [Noviherbaspirillum sedimenti]